MEQTEFHILSVAKICHQANKAYCEVLGDTSQVDWDNAEQWQKDSAVNGVKFLFANPESEDDTMHRNWMNEKFEQGWRYGVTKDAELKTHPCLIPFSELPIEQQKKDKLFIAIVKALG